MKSLVSINDDLDFFRLAHDDEDPSIELVKHLEGQMLVATQTLEQEQFKFVKLLGHHGTESRKEKRNANHDLQYFVKLRRLASDVFENC
jgi:hypothetical protein